MTVTRLLMKGALCRGSGLAKAEQWVPFSRGFALLQHHVQYRVKMPLCRPPLISLLRWPCPRRRHDRGEDCGVCGALGA